MKTIQHVPFAKILRQEVGQHRGIRMENMPVPHDEVHAFLVELEESDASSIFLWHEFSKWSPDWRLSNIDRTSDSLSDDLKSRHKGQPATDIRGSEEIVLTSISRGLPMTVTDGNHRLVSQYLNFSISGVRAFLCVHMELKPGPWMAQPAYNLSRHVTH